MSKYRLKKDWVTPVISYPAGTELYYDKKVELYQIGGHSFHEEELKCKYSWFEEIKEPEKIEITRLQHHDNFKGNKSDSFWYQFCATQLIPIEKVQEVKQAIEETLNDEEKIRMTAIKQHDGLFKIGNKYYVEDGRFGPHKFTLKDMEDCFNEGKGIALAGVKFMDKTMYYKKHESFQDYLQSLNKQ